MAFPLRNRLKKQKDFEEVFQKGKTVQGSFFFLKAHTTSLPVFRCAVAISAKISPTASARNNLRRRIVSALQTLIPPRLSGYDIVIIVRRKPDPGREGFVRDLSKALQQAHIII